LSDCIGSDAGQLLIGDSPEFFSGRGLFLANTAAPERWNLFAPGGFVLNAVTGCLFGRQTVSPVLVTFLRISVPVLTHDRFGIHP
jgi:hypothetical protein